MAANRYKAKILNLTIMKPNILYISQTKGRKNDQTGSYCGVGLQGELTSDILLNGKSDKYIFIREFLDDSPSLEYAIIKYSPSIIFYNYHPFTLEWINSSYVLSKYNNIKHVKILHNVDKQDFEEFNPQKFHDFQYIISDNNTMIGDNKHSFIVSRSIPAPPLKLIEDRNDTIPKIGYQGFGFEHKGIDRIAHQIQNEFDEAIFRLHIPFSFYCDRDGTEARKRIEEVRNIITKPGIKIEVSHNFLSNNEIIEWLHENTINCYFYTISDNGISSSPDYAIAARRPIAINNSSLYKHLHNLHPSIEIEKNSLKQIINNGIVPLLPIYEKYDQKNVVKSYENVCDLILSN
jgi:hypothetical protein